MYTVKVKGRFSAAHQLRGYRGRCERLHGHNWTVEASIASESLNDQGLVMDFKDLKKILGNVLNALDHQFLNEVPPFDKINPSSENIAGYIYDKMDEMIKDTEVQLREITVWESDDSCAIYSTS